MIDLSVNFPDAMAIGRTYPTARSTVCWYKSCSRTMNPVLRVGAKTFRICSNLVRDDSPVASPPGMFQSVYTNTSQHATIRSGRSTHGVKVGVDTIDGSSSPDDRSQTHLSSNRPDSIIDVSVRGSESVWRHTDGGFDDLFAPPKLGNDLFVCELREVWVRPSVYRDLVTGHVLGL